MKNAYQVALGLLVVGGLNWGSVGLLKIDLVAMLFGEMSMLTQLVYVLVGVSALVVLYQLLMKRK